MTKLKEIPMRRDSLEERVAFANRIADLREDLMRQRVIVANRYGYGSIELAAIESILSTVCDENIEASQRVEEF